MSANLDLVRSIFADWERGDFSAVEWADPEIKFVIGDGPLPGTWKGTDGMAEGFRGWLSAWEDVRIESDEYRELDNERVLVLVCSSGRGKASGLDLAQMGGGGSRRVPRSGRQDDEARFVRRLRPWVRRPRPQGVGDVAGEVMTTYPPTPTTDENAQFAGR